MLSTTWVAGVTGLEPAASGVTGRHLRIIRENMVAFVQNTAHRLPLIPTQFCMQNVCTNIRIHLAVLNYEIKSLL